MKCDKVYMYSICMCNYNMENTIQRSLIGILEQMYSSFEIVLVDDASSDRSVDKVKKIQDKMII